MKLKRYKADCNVILRFCALFSLSCFTVISLEFIYMENTNLKFFRVDVSANRNYTAIRIGDDDFAIQDLDCAEVFLLQSWFDRNITDTNVVLIKSQLGHWLGFKESGREVYLSQETLDERLQDLKAIETAFFERLEYIKKPKF